MTLFLEEAWRSLLALARPPVWVVIGWLDRNLRGNCISRFAGNFTGKLNSVAFNKATGQDLSRLACFPPSLHGCPAWLCKCTTEAAVVACVVPSGPREEWHSEGSFLISRKMVDSHQPSAPRE